MTSDPAAVHTVAALPRHGVDIPDRRGGTGQDRIGPDLTRNPGVAG